MKNRDIENKVKKAFSHLETPDVLDAVLSECQIQKGHVIMIPIKKKSSQWGRRIAGIAAACMILLSGTVGLHAYTVNHSIAAIVSLDVNPSIEIKVNRKEKVLEVNARNEAAQIIIGDMDFRNNSLDVTVNALIGSMLRNGYLSEIANSILISVDGDTQEKSEALQRKLTDEINGLLQTSTFSGAVLSQTLSSDKTLEQYAADYGITIGKAQLIQEIIKQNAQAQYTFDSLSTLSINELSLLHKSDSAEAKQIEVIGNTSDKAYIGEENALNAALAHAGLQKSDIGYYEIEFDYEHGVMVYELEFYANGYEYSYDVNAASGEIVGYEKEYDDDIHINDIAVNTNPSLPVSSPTAAYISADEAKAAALSHAQLTEAAVRFMKCELDEDDGRWIYEIEFRADGYEYEYEIDAISGNVQKHERDWDD